MKLSALTFLWLVGIPGFTAGTSSASYAAPATDTAIIFSNPVFPTDSLAIEQAAQKVFQKKVTQSRRYYRKLEATNALFLKRLKKQEARIKARLQQTDSLKYRQYLALKSPGMDSLLLQSKDSAFIHKLNTTARKGRTVLGTLQGLQSFMGKFGNHPLGDASKVSELQQKAALQQYLQQQVAARTGALERLLKGTKLESYGSQLNNTGLQYKQQAGYWKQVLEEPDAAEAKALDYLRGIEGFEEQLNPAKGTSLAGKSAAELEAMGYQTKAKVGEQLQQQFGDQLGNMSQKAGEQLKEYAAALDKPLAQVKQVKQKIKEGKAQIEEGKSTLQSAKRTV